MRLLPVLAILLSLAASIGAARDRTKPVGPEEAANKVNEEVTLQMEVKSATLRDDVCFLNSHEDFKDAKNFTGFIGWDALQTFRDAKIDDPADHFKGKTVRVKGKLTLYRDKPQIIVYNPGQIEVVKKP